MIRAFYSNHGNSDYYFSVSERGNMVSWNGAAHHAIDEEEAVLEAMKQADYVIQRRKEVLQRAIKGIEVDKSKNRTQRGL